MGMQTVNQTDAAINALPLGSGTYLIRPRSDKKDSIKGLMIVCNAASASFVIQRKLKRLVNGKQKSVRVGLGVRGVVTLDEAMAKARDVLKNIDAGLDPNALRRAAREEESQRLTLRSAFALYKGDGGLSAKTISMYDHHMEAHLFPWLDRTMLEIGNSKLEIIALHKKLTEEHGWAAGNNAIKLLSYVYNRASEIEDDLRVNPCRAVHYNEERKRDTALSDTQLRDWFRRVMLLANPVKRMYWLTVLLTGGRREQMAAAKWDHINFDIKSKRDKEPSRPTWHFPDENAKAGRGYDIPLAPFVVKLLGAWQTHVQQEYPTAPQCGFVFPSAKSAEGHLKKPRNERQGLKETAHPLRHTFRTQGMDKAIRLSKTEAKILMGHKLSRGEMDERYITRADAVEKVRPQQEAMTARYLKLLRLTDDSIKAIIWSDVPRGAWDVE
jgi:integrase